MSDRLESVAGVTVVSSGTDDDPGAGTMPFVDGLPVGAHHRLERHFCRRSLGLQRGKTDPEDAIYSFALDRSQQLCEHPCPDALVRKRQLQLFLPSAGFMLMLSCCNSRAYRHEENATRELHRRADRTPPRNPPIF
jgi:hypothetical protein